MRRMLVLVPALGLAIACGARTPLLEDSPDAQASDSGVGPDFDAPLDTGPVGVDVPIEPHDTSFPDIFVQSDATFVDVIGEGDACEVQQNTSYPPADCGGPNGMWFAWPWSPPTDMDVARIEIHTTGGSVALLTDANALPGTVLFQGPVGTSGTAAWLGADLTPAVHVTAGQPYWHAEEAQYCSQALGGTQFIEYYGPTLGGPWVTTGTGSYTTHVFGMCQ